MNARELASSAATDASPSDGLPIRLLALWLARKGQWHEAHDLCQEIPGRDGAWIHAWLHRQEGDYGNACYWYAQAGKPAPSRNASLEDEWMDIATALATSAG